MNKPIVAALLALIASASVQAQPTADRAKAMAKLGFMRGIWKGPASGVEADGKRYSVLQTERMGPMLGGDIIVVEGRGYKDDGSVGFNALGVISWDAQSGKYEFRSYAQGYAGTFEMKLTQDGYVYEIPMGQATIRYTATVKDGLWREVGERLMQGKPPVQIFEMNLKRHGDTDWPSGNPVAK